MYSNFWWFHQIKWNQQTKMADLWSNRREWASGKLVEYESLRVSNGQVGSSRLKICQVASRYASIHYKFQFFNVKYYAIIEIVKCESGRMAQKWLIVSRICEFWSTTCSLPNFTSSFFLSLFCNGSKLINPLKKDPVSTKTWVRLVWHVIANILTKI